MSEKNKLKSSIKYPTSIIVRGDDFLGVEIAKSLIEQGGYVIVVDHDIDKTIERYKEIEDQKLLSIINFESIDYLDDDLRRLDYVFFLNHEYDNSNFKISSQEFLQVSNYLDLMLNLSSKFDAKFVLTSSIRANQIILEHGELDLNFGKSSTSAQMVYTQMEIQRYAETLCMESVEKLGIDARITRLGIVVGKGMDFDLNRSFDRLIFQAVKAKNLELTADGLETNLYVHVLDCAYGLIKAMFTKGTQGKIYSISNQEEISDLSIAYKLQEITGLNRDIRFIDSSNDLPPIRFYKPVTNLSAIGWTPRISFTRALNQSLDYARSLEEDGTQIDEIVSPEEVVEDLLSDDQPKGALARLIAERKRQEKARSGSILLAAQRVQTKKKENRNLTRYEKFQRYLQAKYDNLANNLQFLKKVTVAESFFYAITFLIFVLIYFAFISPGFVMIKETIRLNYYNSQIANNIDQANIDELDNSIKGFDSSLGGFIQNYKKFEVIYSLLGKEHEYRSNINSLNTYKLYSDSLSSSLDYIVSFDEYWNQNEFGLVLKPNSESKLILSQYSTNQALIENINTSSVEATQSSKKLELAKKAIDDVANISVLGYDIDENMTNLVAGEDYITDLMSFINGYSQMMMKNEKHTYILVIQDNSRYTPSGGYPASIGFFSAQSGQITDILFTPVTENMRLSSLTKSELDEIQTNSGEIVSTTQVEIDDLFLLKDRNVIREHLIDYMQDQYGINARTVIYINLEAVASLANYKGGVEINSVMVNEATILNALELLQKDTGKVEDRNNVITELAASIFVEYTTNKSLLTGLLSTFKEYTRTRGVFISSQNYELMNSLAMISNNPNEKNWAFFALGIDPNAVKVKVFPSMDLKVEDYIESDFVINRKITINPGSNEHLERVITCVPSNAFDFSLDNRLALGQAFSDSQICVAGDFSRSEKVSFSYKFRPQIENLGTNEYNVNLELLVAPGSKVKYDWDISKSPDIKFKDIGDLSLAGQVIVSSGNLENSLNIDFIIEK